MEAQKKYSGLICLSILPSNYRQLERQDAVLAETPEVYKDGLLVHPAIPGLMLTREQRLSRGSLEIVDCDNDFLCREETVSERICRIKWTKPIPATPSRTDFMFVKMDMSLFGAEHSAPPKHYYPSDIEAHEKKVVDERELLRRKEVEADIAATANAVEVQRGEAVALFKAEEKGAAIAAHEEEVNEVATAAADALDKLHYLQASARETAEKLKRENADDEKKSHRRNLEWRLASVQSRLQLLIDDIEAGKPLGELQIFADEDLEDEFEIMVNEIALLKRSIQVLKGNERGL